MSNERKFGIQFTGDSGECYLGVNKANDGYLRGWNIEILGQAFSNKKDVADNIMDSNPVAVKILLKQITAKNALKNPKFVEYEY